MLQLADVTLCCVDTRTPELALAAMARCMAGIRFADAVLFTDAARVPEPPTDVRVVDVRIDSVPAYSEFMVKGLAPHVRSSHLLVVQWDSWVLDPSAWDPAFLDWDYIGPLWPQFEGEQRVGNGGFSLRSKALLEALQDPALAAMHPEDLCICHEHRPLLEQRHGLRFAPAALARRFGYEREAPSDPAFGFHGLFNFHRVMPPDALRTYLQALPPGMCGGRDGRDLCRELIRLGRLDVAGIVLRKRWQQGLRDKHTLRLALRLGWERLRAWT